MHASSHIQMRKYDLGVGTELPRLSHARQRSQEGASHLQEDAMLGVCLGIASIYMRR